MEGSFETFVCKRKPEGFVFGHVRLWKADVKTDSPVALGHCPLGSSHPHVNIRLTPLPDKLHEKNRQKDDVPWPETLTPEEVRALLLSHAPQCRELPATTCNPLFSAVLFMYGLRTRDPALFCPLWSEAKAHCLCTWGRHRLSPAVKVALRSQAWVRDTLSGAHSQGEQSWQRPRHYAGCSPLGLLSPAVFAHTVSTFPLPLLDFPQVGLSKLVLSHCFGDCSMREKKMECVSFT